MKTVDPEHSKGYTEFEGPSSHLLEASALDQLLKQMGTLVPRRSLKLYFDDVVAGEPTLVAKNGELISAATFGATGRAKTLLEEGADIHTDNDCPLQVAAANGHVETVEFLLKCKADVHAEDDQALLDAARSGYHDIVDLLLRHGANPHARNDGALRLASQFRVQSAGSFNACRPTPVEGHKKTIDLLSAQLRR